MTKKSPIAVVAAIVSLASVCAGEGVKYRGVFVNDEDWSLRPWAVKHFGKDEGTDCWEKFSEDCGK